MLEIKIRIIKKETGKILHEDTASMDPLTGKVIIFLPVEHNPIATIQLRSDDIIVALIKNKDAILALSAKLFEEIE